MCTFTTDLSLILQFIYTKTQLKLLYYELNQTIWDLSGGHN